MRNIIVANKKPIPIGRYGENEETTIQFSINAFFPDMPDADFGLVHQRHGDAAPYPCVISELNGFINWRIGSADVAKVGSGTAQLSAYKNGSISKTVIFTTETLNSLGMVDPPSPETAWVDEVLTAGTAAVNAAERASTYAERAQAVADNIDTIVSESLDEAKESGEFDGPPGDPGFSPAVTVADIEGGHRVIITDEDHPTGQSFDVMDGDSVEEIFWATYGTTTYEELDSAYQDGKILACKHTDSQDTTDRIFTFVERTPNDNTFRFACVRPTGIYYLTCNSATWSESNFELPSTAGTYALKVVNNGGVRTYSWVAQS